MKNTTYKKVQEIVGRETDRYIHTCWIADVLTRNGVVLKKAHNRQGEKRVQPCPDNMVGPIEKVLREYQEI